MFSRKAKYVRRRRALLLVAVLLLAGTSFGIYKKATTPVEYDVYYVQPGDTLWDIAYSIYGDRYRTSDMYNEIMRLNGLSSCTIHYGDALRYRVR